MYASVVGANALWAQRVTGRGVSVAVLDSGVAPDPDLGGRILTSVNFAGPRSAADPGGHGTHVAGIIAGDGTRSNGEFTGVAPDANIVDVRVLDATGAGRLSSVIRGIEWSVAHRAEYNIRVLNMSFGAPTTTPYQSDPLASAVEVAWRAGLVVVAASGNLGPAMNSTVTPGIDPYAITVGASDDVGTVSASDDSLAPFSSWGTAYSDPKPDLVAPGRRIVSISVPGSALDLVFPDRIVRARNGAAYLRLSGTSQATGVVSGAVALLLQRSPGLDPDQVKSTLVESTRAFGTTPPANPVAQGSGLLDVNAAAASVPAPAGQQIQGTAVIGTITHAARPANAFARSVYPLLARLPLRWKDPTLGGIDWNALTWDSVGWDDSVAWDNFDWDSVGWDESVAWDSVGWDSVGWDSVGWDSVGWDESVAWDSSGFD